MLDEFITLLRILFYLILFIFLLICLPFVVIHVAEHWDDPIYPHSGFCPDCPTWEEPYEPENTLPPTYYLASDSEL